jgi:hypothetical protein
MHCSLKWNLSIGKKGEGKFFAAPPSPCLQLLSVYNTKLWSTREPLHYFSAEQDHNIEKTKYYVHLGVLWVGVTRGG